MVTLKGSVHTIKSWKTLYHSRFHSGSQRVYTVISFSSTANLIGIFCSYSCNLQLFTHYLCTFYLRRIKPKCTFYTIYSCGLNTCDMHTKYWCLFLWWSHKLFMSYPPDVDVRPHGSSSGYYSDEYSPTRKTEPPHQDFGVPGMLHDQDSPKLSRKAVQPSDVIIMVSSPLPTVCYHIITGLETNLWKHPSIGLVTCSL